MQNKRPAVTGKGKAGEGCLGPGAECVSQPQKSKLAEASVFRGSHQPPHRLRFSVFPCHYWEWWRLSRQESINGTFGTTAPKCQVHWGSTGATVSLNSDCWTSSQTLSGLQYETWAREGHWKTGPQGHSRTHELTAELSCRALPGCYQLS